MSILKKLSMASVGAALVVMGMLNAGNAQALTPKNIGPDGYGYRATDDTNGDNTVDDDDYLFEDISERTSAVGILNNIDNGSVTGANIGFSFKFYGTSYTQLSISSNGLLYFGTGTNNSGSNLNLQTTNLSPNLPTIAPLWDDWRPIGDIYYDTVGSLNDRRFIVQ